MNYQYKDSDLSPNKVEIHMGLLSIVENTSQLITETDFIIRKKQQRLRLWKQVEWKYKNLLPGNHITRNPNRNREIELPKQHKISKNSYKQDPSDTNSMNNIHDELDMTITISLNLQIP